MRSARPIALLMVMALVLLTACSAPSLSLAPSAPSDTQVVVSFFTPNGKGDLTVGLEALDVTTGKLLWKTPLDIIPNLPQIIYDTLRHPTIEKGVVFATTFTHVVAVRESDGKLLWRVPPPGSCSGGSFTVDESAIALHCGVLYVLDPATGAERWHLANPVGRDVMRHGVIYATADLMGDASDLTPQSPGTPAPTFDVRQHPPVGTALVALNARDGSLLWQVREDVTFDPIAVTDRTLYLSGLTTPAGTTIPYPNTYAFDTHSGRPLTASSHAATGPAGSTFYASGQFVAATDRFVLVYDFQTDPTHPRTWALSASDGKVLWDVPGDIFADGLFDLGVLINDDFIYHAGNNGVTAFRVSDGSVAWTWSFEEACFTSSLRVIGGLVFATSATHIVGAPCPRRSLVSLSAATGALNWQHNLDGVGEIAMPAMELLTTMP